MPLANTIYQVTMAKLRTLLETAPVTGPSSHIFSIMVNGMTPSFMTHYICVAVSGELCSFENGYHQICDIISHEKYHYLFQCAKECNDFNSFIRLIA